MKLTILSPILQPYYAVYGEQRNLNLLQLFFRNVNSLPEVDNSIVQTSRMRMKFLNKSTGF